MKQLKKKIKKIQSSIKTRRTHDTLGLVKKLKCSQDFILINNAVVTLSIATQLHSLDGNTELTIKAGCDITLV